ncbi:MAG: hypothetical protein WC856_07835 [Methylococcaceae bacterium]|jgi:hypothetical protein
MPNYNNKPGAKPGNKNAQVGDYPATSQLQIRCTQTEKASWVHAANGEKLSDWVRNTLNAAAKDA